MRQIADRFGFLAFGVVAMAIMLILPTVVEIFTLLELTIYVIMGILALSLGFIWGFAGILCFGQAAYFGLGAYAYAVAVINFGDSTLAMLIAIVVPAIFAMILGYFMFFGRISDVYVGVITLTVSLILFNLFNSTAGDIYRIGNAALGGFNGIPSIPTLTFPFGSKELLDPAQTFQVCVFLLACVYYGLRFLLNRRFGRVIVAIRENECRAELLGFDVRLYKLGAFVIGGAIAGLAGALFANWGAFVSPTIFGLPQSAQIIIWVIVGGVGTLVGPVLGAFAIQWLTSWLGTLNLINTNLVLGILLVAFVLLVPRGLLPSLRAALRMDKKKQGVARSEPDRPSSTPLPASSIEEDH